MNAKQLLDKVRDGQNFSYAEITAALIATGDLDGRMAAGVRSPRVDEALERASVKGRHESSESMVVTGHFKDRGDPRPWCSAYLASRHEKISV